MQYFIVTEKNGDRSLVCAPDEKALSELIAAQDEDFEFESYLRLDANTFDRAGFIMYEQGDERDIYELFAERERVAERLRKIIRL